MAALCYIAMTLFAAAAGAAAPLHLGGSFSIAADTPIEEIVAHPERYHGRFVRTSGIVASVCNEEGCFIEVVPKRGGAGIVANFPGLAHTFPTDCAGLEATVEGILYRKIYHSARVSHWQHHSYHAGRAIPDYSMILRMEVSAADIGGSRAAIPELAEIPPASPYRVDLDLEEFEDEGFGIGKKHLEEGIAKRRPASGATRTLIVCTSGSVSVTREGAAAIRLGPGDMAYLPPATPCEMLAESEGGADVLIVYADIVKKEPEHAH